MPKTHYVKSWPYLFAAAKAGIKTHDVRYINERDYQPGDRMVLQEFDPVTQRYTGEELAVRITYITSANNHCALSPHGLAPGYGILSIQKEEA